MVSDDRHERLAAYLLGNTELYLATTEKPDTDHRAARAELLRCVKVADRVYMEDSTEEDEAEVLLWNV